MDPIRKKLEEIMLLLPDKVAMQKQMEQLIVEKGINEIKPHLIQMIDELENPSVPDKKTAGALTWLFEKPKPE